MWNRSRCGPTHAHVKMLTFALHVRTLRLCITHLLFNSNLILLQPPRNGDGLPCSHWGGTDHGELKDPGQRRGTASSALRLARQPLAHLLFLCPVFLPCARFPSSPDKLPREACPQIYGKMISAKKRTMWRDFRWSAGGEVRRGSRFVGAWSLDAAGQARHRRPHLHLPPPGCPPARIA
jgi:hypothetical protein